MSAMKKVLFYDSFEYYLQKSAVDYYNKEFIYYKNRTFSNTPLNSIVALYSSLFKHNIWTD